MENTLLRRAFPVGHDCLEVGDRQLELKDVFGLVAPLRQAAQEHVAALEHDVNVLAIGGTFLRVAAIGDTVEPDKRLPKALVDGGKIGIAAGGELLGVPGEGDKNSHRRKEHQPQSWQDKLSVRVHGGNLAAKQPSDEPPLVPISDRRWLIEDRA